MITLFFVNDSGGAQEVAPPNALEARMSTNPIAIGIPRCNNKHLILDMATTTVAYGRLCEIRDRNEPVPSEWVNSQGLLKHFGGFKGFGLAIIAEALAGALTGGGTVSPNPPHENQSYLLIGIDIERFRPLSSFKDDVENFVEYVTNVPMENNSENLRMPGEKGTGYDLLNKVKEIAVQPFMLNQLNIIASKFNMNHIV